MGRQQQTGTWDGFANLHISEACLCGYYSGYSDRFVRSLLVRTYARQVLSSYRRRSVVLIAGGLLLAGHPCPLKELQRLSCRIQVTHMQPWPGLLERFEGLCWFGLGLTLVSAWSVL